MKLVLVALWTIVMCSLAGAQETSKDRAVTVGSWQIDASFTEARKFDRCVMTHTTADGIKAQFTRNEGGLSLVLTSPRWELEKGVTYPVEFAAGSTKWKSDVAATNDAVRISLTDKNFNEALKRANTLEIRAARSTINVPLRKSAAALARLERCYESNNKAAETNPFAAPKP
jgi:hypothetical protein